MVTWNLVPRTREKEAQITSKTPTPLRGVHEAIGGEWKSMESHESPWKSGEGSGSDYIQDKQGNGYGEERGSGSLGTGGRRKNHRSEVEGV